MLKNKVALVVDVSGSMASIRTQAMKVVDSIIESLQNEAHKYRNKQKTALSLYVFDDKISRIYHNVNIVKAPKFKQSDFRLGNSTSLWDATGEAISDAKDDIDYDDNDTSFVTIIVTDGGENSSLKYSAYALKRLIRDVQNTDRFTITFQVPYGHRNDIIRQLDIPDDNVREWETGTVRGIEDVGYTTKQAFQGYYGQRAMGLTSSRSFYQTNVAHLKSRDLNNKLDDLSKDFQIITADRESQIRDLVEDKVGIYKLGKSYYQLLKTEKVQSGKDVLILNRSNNHIYGGSQARKLIGLPTNTEAKVEPGLHGQYEIFIQSTSVNRKIGRGTKVLVKKW